ncbi:MAG: hypothetical protein MJB57_03100 [Gemmatimonadetes bacterium]|nr:hypothetical protein [Gemmatimonadota bacterium]
MTSRFARSGLRLTVALVAGVAWGASTATAQTYSKGQNISPAYEGWEQNEDGSYNFLFGYMNRNWLEEVDVPVGPENGFSPGPADRGQPTRFLPRRNRWVFKVRVPADWGDKELVWTLTTQGTTEHAYASLRPDYIVDNVVIASETGALGAGSSDETTRSNTPPTIRLEGDETRRVRVGEPLTLVAVVGDDGLPPPRRRPPPDAEPAPADARYRLSARQLRPPARVTVDKVVGLNLAWFVYRGEGDVRFDPLQVKVWEDTRTGANSPWAPLWRAPEVPEGGRYEVTVTFDRPGTYVLRGRADDGGLYSDQDVTVIVSPATASE